jgi:uncharacterized delta-60 repeat protein
MPTYHSFSFARSGEHSKSVVKRLSVLMRTSVVGVVAAMLVLCGVPSAFAQIMDPPFVVGTGFNGPVRDILQLPSGQLIVVGNFTIYNGNAVNSVVRLNADGSWDNTFVAPAALSGTQVNTVALQGTNLIIGGQFSLPAQNRVARLTAAGALDGGFTTTGTGFDGEVMAVAVDGMSRVIAVGAFANYNGTSRVKIARLTAAGALDAGFAVGAGLVGGSSAEAVTLDGGGNIVVGGSFISYDGTPSRRIARITPTGAIDATFNTGGAAGGFPAGVVQEVRVVGTTIYVGGSFGNYRGNASQNIVRIQNNGNYDAGFAVGAGFDGLVNSIATDGAGRLLVGGGFTNYNGTGRNNLARLQTSGAVDATFNPGDGFDNEVRKVINQADNKIVVGGQFNTYNTTSPRARIARFGFAAAAYVSAIFPEAVANDGSVTVTRTITLGPTAPTPGDDFEEWVVGPLVAGVHYNAANVPPGLTLVATRTNNKVVTLSLTGNAAAHANVNDVTNMQITWLNAALLGNNAVGVANLNSTLYTVDFIDPAGATFPLGATFTEAGANNGTITMTRTIVLTGGETWTGANGRVLALGTDYNSVAGVPAGLTMQIVKTSNTTLTISFTGTAAAHAAANNSSVSPGFLNAAVTSGNAASVVNLNTTPLNINFLDPYSAAYSGTTFGEAAANNGSIDNSAPRTVTLTSETWTGANGRTLALGTDYTLSGTAVPAGLTMRLVKLNANTVQIFYTGNAGAHAMGNSVTGIQINFAAASLTGGTPAAVTGLNAFPANNLAINFNDPAPTAVYSAVTFPEALPANNGSITMTRTVTLSGRTFDPAVAIGGTLTAGTHYNPVNVPAGLTMVVTKTAANIATISFTGNAASHTTADNVANVQVGFLDAALNTGTAASVINLNGTNLSITYTNPVEASYSGTAFSEDGANLGFIGTTVDVDLVGVTWVPGGVLTPGTHYTVAGIPPGQVFTATAISPTRVRLAFTGAATNHAAGDSGPFTLTFLNAAVSNGNVGLITGLSPQVLSVNFNSPAPPPPPPPPPTPTPWITSLSSESGLPGQTISIFGQNLTNVTSVIIAGVPATNIQSNGSVVTATLGPAANGTTGPVQVMTAFGPATYNSFTYGPPPPPVPRIFTINPGTATVGETVTLGGQVFTGATQVRVGGVPITGFTVVNDNTITFPVTTPISGLVEVFTPNGNAQLLGLNYRPLPAPVINVVSPAQLEAVESPVMVRLGGMNFSNPGSVRISSTTGTVVVPVTSVTPDGREASFTLPAAMRLPGVLSLQYITPDNQTSNNGSLRILPGTPPTVAPITFPMSSTTTANGSPFTFTLNGSNFFSNAQVTITGRSADGTIFNQFPLPTSVLSPSNAVVTVPGSVNNDGGTYTVRVINPDGTFTETPLVINRRPAPLTTSAMPIVQPNATGTGEDVFIVVRGQNFFNPFIELGGTQLPIVSWSPEQIVARVPRSVAQSINASGVQPVVIVTNGDRQATGLRPAIRFPLMGEQIMQCESPMPRITSLVVAPSATSTNATGTGFTVILNGENFVPGATVQLSGTDVAGRIFSGVQLSARVLGPTQAIVQIPAGVNQEPGQHTITLNNGCLNMGRPTVASVPLTINCRTEPTINSVSSTSRTLPNGEVENLMTIRGEGFDRPSVEFIGATPEVVSWTPQEIVTRIPAPLANRANAACRAPLVIVRNPDGTADALRTRTRFTPGNFSLTASILPTQPETPAELLQVAATEAKAAQSNAKAGAKGQVIASAMEVYPNPATSDDDITVTLPESFIAEATASASATVSTSALRWKIVDNLGKTVRSSVGTAGSTNGEQRIPLQGLNSGAYQVMFTDGKKTIARTFIVRR